MNWFEKTRYHDLYFCATEICHVVTFIGSRCPFCKQPGNLIRERGILDIGDRIEEGKAKRESLQNQTRN